MASIHVPSSAPALVVIKQLTINVSITTDAVDHVAAVRVGQEIGKQIAAGLTDELRRQYAAHARLEEVVRRS